MSVTGARTGSQSDCRGPLTAISPCPRPQWRCMPWKNGGLRAFQHRLGPTSFQGLHPRFVLRGTSTVIISRDCDERACELHCAALSPSPASRALLLSQAGPHSARAITVPTTHDAVLIPSAQFRACCARARARWRLTPASHTTCGLRSAHGSQLAVDATIVSALTRVNPGRGVRSSPAKTALHSSGSPAAPVTPPPASGNRKDGGPLGDPGRNRPPASKPRTTAARPRMRELGHEFLAAAAFCRASGLATPPHRLAALGTPSLGVQGTWDAGDSVAQAQKSCGKKQSQGVVSDCGGCSS